MEPRTVAVLGAGPAGTAVAGALHDAGFRIAAMFSRSQEHASRAVRTLNLPAETLATSDAAAATTAAQIVIFAVPDRAVADLAVAVSAGSAFKNKILAAHMSGALSSSVLEPAALQGAPVGSMHPMKSFAGKAEDRDFRGVSVGVEGEDAAVQVIEELVRAVGGAPLRVRTEDKALYHAASSIVSNFTVSVFHLGLQILEGIGVPRKAAMPALASLLAGTARNVAELGVPAALTGPIARGDTDTVAAHLESLRLRAQDKIALYAALARYTVSVAQEKGSLSVKDAEVLKSMLARHI